MHFQKTLLPQFTLVHLICKIFGKKTVYDIDDQPHNAIVAVLMFTNAFLCDVLTVDTNEREKYWASFFSWKKVVVIPDVLDVGELKLLESPSRSRDKSKKASLVWIGHPLNVSSIESLLQIDHSDRYALTVITAKEHLIALKMKHPNVSFVPWEKDILFNRDMRFDFMILNHQGGEVAEMKSDNKMALAIAAGIMPIVSDTPSYRRLARNLGYEKFIFGSIEDVIQIVESATEGDFDTLQSAKLAVVRKYAPEVVAKQFLEHVLP